MKMIKYLPVVVLGLICAFQTSQAQVKVGDNPTTINANSVLEIESADKGLLLPRIALTSLTSPAPLANHVEGMQVYNTSDDVLNDLAPGIYYNDGTKWKRANNEVQRNIIDGDGPPSNPCSNPGEMYTDTTTGSPTEGEIWICSGGTWQPYSPDPSSSSSNFFIGKSNIDAKANKDSQISRNGGLIIAARNYSGNFQNGTGNTNIVWLQNNGRITSQTNTENLTLTKRSAAVNRTFVAFRVNGVGIGSIQRSSTANAIVYNTSSDLRLKENIVSTRYSINELLKIAVKDYNYIADSANTKTTGFIAQELYKIYPEAVSVGGDDENTEPWQVDYGKLTPLLVKAIQDQQKEIEELKTTINTRLAWLEAQELKNNKRNARRKITAKNKRRADLAMIKN